MIELFELLRDKINMGGYASYVWSAYGVSFVVLCVTLSMRLRALRKQMNQHDDPQA